MVLRARTRSLQLRNSTTSRAQPQAQQENERRAKESFYSWTCIQKFKLAIGVYHGLLVMIFKGECSTFLQFGFFLIVSTSICLNRVLSLARTNQYILHAHSWDKTQHKIPLILTTPVACHRNCTQFFLSHFFAWKCPSTRNIEVHAAGCCYRSASNRPWCSTAALLNDRNLLE